MAAQFGAAVAGPAHISAEPHKDAPPDKVLQPGLEHRPFSDEEIKQAFDTFDLDKNRFVGAAELSHILKLIGEEVTDEEIDEMIRICDGDGDGQVTFDEFYKLMTNPPPPVAPYNQGEASGPRRRRGNEARKTYYVGSSAAAAAAGRPMGGVGVGVGVGFAGGANQLPKDAQGAATTQQFSLASSSGAAADRSSSRQQQQQQQQSSSPYALAGAQSSKASASGGAANGVAAVSPPLDAYGIPQADKDLRANSVEFLIKKLSGGLGKIKPSQIKKVYKRFQDIDVDKSGAIDYMEFIRALEMEDNTISRQMFRVFDMDGSNCIELKEFIVVLSRYTSAATSEKLKFAFMMFDEDGSGYIERDELIQMLAASFVVEGFSHEELEERADMVFNFLNKKKNGKISYEDFMKLSTAKNGLIYPVESEKHVLGKDVSINALLSEARSVAE